ncbi:MAG: DUF881 domain-containing protein [Patescibacteria group bacterium]
MAVCILFGSLFAWQAYSGKEARRELQPENNATLALEVAKLTKMNANLREDVKGLTKELDSYKNSSNEAKDVFAKYESDKVKLDIINGESSASGQGISLGIESRLNRAQLVDLVNAIKNIGSSLISCNGIRINSRYDLAVLAGQTKYEILVLGNSNLLKSAITRKGGVIEQIMPRDAKVKIEQVQSLTVPRADTPSEIILSKYIMY